jgi:hypothetical protein
MAGNIIALCGKCNIANTIPAKKGCGGEVYFDKKMKSANGVPIPISKATGFLHQCGDKYYR